MHSLVFTLLSNYCVSGPILHTVDTAVNKTDEPSALAVSLMKEKNQNQEVEPVLCHTVQRCGENECVEKRRGQLSK